MATFVVATVVVASENRLPKKSGNQGQQRNTNPELFHLNPPGVMKAPELAQDAP